MFALEVNRTRENEEDTLSENGIGERGERRGLEKRFGQSFMGENRKS